MTTTEIPDLTRLARKDIREAAALLDTEQARYLVDYYADDIRKTGELIGRDLSGWLRPTTA